MYWHKNKINGKLYIGISKNIKKRWISTGSSYKNSHYFYNAIQKYGWDNFEHEIITTNLTKEEAFRLEMDLIKKYNTTNPDKGYNLSAGGAGCSGAIDNPNTKRAYVPKKVYQYDFDGNFIKEWISVPVASKELGINLTVMYQAAEKSHSAGGYLWRYEYCDKIDCYNPNGSILQARNFLQIDTNFNVVQKYHRITDISKNFNATLILLCCKNKRLSHSGYYWCYEDEYDEDLFKQRILDGIANRHYKNRPVKQINQYDENYHLINTYISANDVASKTKLSATAVQQYCNKGSANYGFNSTGFYWRYAEDMIAS